MYIGFTDEQQALREEVRAYVRELMTPELQEEVVNSNLGGRHSRAAVAQMGRDGWLGIGWPEEYGGQGRPEIEQFIFIDEAWSWQAPVPFLTINTVAKTLMQFGTPAQKDFFLPRILRGELLFAIGYTEPGAGTDLASLSTRAVRDGDEWVINGQKVFTSYAGFSDYVWLAARTDPEASKHAGISIFLVPTTTPGFSWDETHLIVPTGTTSTYYQDVRVPADAVVGEVNRGWELIVTQLNHERLTIAPPGMVELLFDDVTEWARSTRLGDGERVIDVGWVRANLARVRAKLEVLRLMNWRLASDVAMNPADASATKVYGTEFFIEAYRLMLEVVGQAGTLRRGSPGAALAGRLERAYQGTLILTFGGGANEVQRDLIAMFGLKMPRTPRL